MAELIRFWNSLKPLTGNGARLVMVHAGGKEEFVSSAVLLYKWNQTCGDYHHDTNFENYGKQ